MKRTILILFAGLLTAAFSSCEKWLAVRPQTEVEAGENFKSAQGFKDALAGIYILMTDNNLYGQELSYGMVDVLGKQITQPYLDAGDTGGAYAPFFRFDYTTLTAESTIARVWSRMYNVIANLNLLILHIDMADRTMFVEEEYNMIRGEAYGLRAFLHFDLLRLFGYSYKAGADKLAIPYETTFDNRLTAFSTVAGIIEMALADLAVAELSLADDPVMEDARFGGGDNAGTWGMYRRNRFQKFNYYAVKLLQARIHLYKADYDEAFKAADKVIQQEVFTWVPPDEVTTASTATRNMIFSQEVVFALYISDMKTLINGIPNADGTETKGWGTYYNKSIEQWNTVYETEIYGFDFRNQYLKQDAGAGYYPIKLHQYSSSTTTYTNRLPVMRLSEAYYIAAECKLHQNDPGAAVGYLNTVRRARNILVDLPQGVSTDQVQNEIFKEYAKEFLMEGQLYYYYKRLDSRTVRFYPNPVSSDNYVFPIPLAEEEGRFDEQ